MSRPFNISWSYIVSNGISAYLKANETASSQGDADDGEYKAILANLFKMTTSELLSIDLSSFNKIVVS